jgi:WD40 repeat protein
VSASSVSRSLTDISSESVVGIVAPATERKIVYDALYNAAQSLPPELISLIVDYHETPFKGAVLQELPNERLNAESFVALPKNRMASGHGSGVIKVWDLTTNRCHKVFYLGDQSAISVLCFFQESMFLAGSRDGNLYILDAETGKEIKKICSGRPDSDPSLLVPLSSGTFLRATCNPAIQIINNVQFGSEFRICFPKADRWCKFAALDSSTLVFAVGGSDERWLGIIDGEVLLKKALESSCAIMDKNDFKLVRPQPHCPSCMTVLRNKRLAVGLEVGCITILDYEKGITLATFKAHRWFSRVRSIIELPNSDIVLVGVDAIKVWDISSETPKCIKELAGSAPFVSLGDGRFVSGGQNGAIKIWR